MNYFFTADEHYNHSNIIKSCNRPFADVEEMNETLIANHNAVVGKDDTVYHLGDFCFSYNWKQVWAIINRLNGGHLFLAAPHDNWAKNYWKMLGDSPNYFVISKQIHRIKLLNQNIVISHFPLRSWPLSNYGSWNLHGHSHGRMAPFKNQWDVGVDNNDYKPVLLDMMRELINATSQD